MTKIIVLLSSNKGDFIEDMELALLFLQIVQNNILIYFAYKNGECPKRGIYA